MSKPVKSGKWKREWLVSDPARQVHAWDQDSDPARQVHAWDQDSDPARQVHVWDQDRCRLMSKKVESKRLEDD